jgi:hypothetical protein
MNPALVITMAITPNSSGPKGIGDEEAPLTLLFSGDSWHGWIAGMEGVSQRRE